MTKRSKLMLGLSAMLVASAGIAATGTFAWMTVSATLNAGSADTAAITCSTAASNLGTFTITPVLYNAADDAEYTGSAVTLSDSGGNVYVGALGAKTTNVNSANPIENTYVKINVRFHIAYSGPLSNAGEIKSAWNDSAAETFKATITETTSYSTDDNKPSATIATAMTGEGALKTAVVGTDVGLKYKLAAPTRGSGTWTNAATGMDHTAAKNKLDSSTFSLDLSSESFSAPASAGVNTYTSSADTAAAKTAFWVGVIGIDGVVQEPTDAYSLSIGVSGGGITA